MRKAARRNGTRVVTLTSRPGTLDPNADGVGAVRAGRGRGRACRARLATRLRAGSTCRGWRPAPGAEPGAIAAAADVLRGRAATWWSCGASALSHGDRGPQAVDALLAVAQALGVAGKEESGLIEVPAATNARGMRELGVLPNLAPGLTDAREAGMGAPRSAARWPRAT